MKKNTSSKARRRRFEKRRKSTSTRLAGSESLEPRQLLSVSPHNNWVNTVADLNGDTQQTERVAQMLTKIPEGANQALAIAANWTDLQGLDLEIKVDNNGDGVFDASEIVTTHGEAETLVDLATPTGTPGFAGEGAYSVGYACSFPGMGDCGLTDQTGLDAVHSAVYIHPIGSSAISRNVMVTLSGSLTTDILGTIGSYDNVAQGDTVGNTHAVGNSEIDLGLTYDQPGNAGANDEGDVGFNGPAPGGGVEYTALKYPGTVPSGTPGYSINVNAGNSALDAVHARFVNGTGTDALSPVGNSIQVGAGQTVLPNGVTGGNYTQSGARSSGGVSMDPDGTFDWTFTDTVDSDGARFFSHAAVEIRNVDGVVPYDFGDAPDPSYDTLLANDGPRHAVFNPAGDLVGGPYFGPNSPDAEMDGQPEALAGMMTGGDDFTDGVFDLLRLDVGEGAGPANSSTVVQITVVQAGGATTFFTPTLDGNPGLETVNIGLTDVTSVEFLSVAGNGNEAFTIDNIVTDFGTAQFEGSNAQATGTQSVVTNPIYSTGFNFASSLNETHLVNTDGPISSNGTTTLKIDDSEGAGNVVTMSMVSVDDEDGVLDYYNNNANGAGGDVPTEMFVSDFMNTSAATVALDIQGVSASEPGYVSAWIDWNADGDFADANEVITTGFAVTANGELELPVTIPASMGGGITSSGESIMRIRIHSDPCAEGAALAPTGHAHDGEVEDHKVVIKQGSSVHGTKYEDINGDGTADDIFGPGNAQGDTSGVMVEIVNDDGSSVTDLLGYSVDPVETDANGDYWFSYLPAGDYIVRERLDLTDINDDDTADNGQGLAQHDPTDMHIGNADYPIQHEITLGTDHGGDDLYTAAKIEDLDFLNYVEGSIHGVKFDDLNADGNFDFPDEIGLPGVTFELYKFIDTYNYTFNPHTSANEISFTTYKWDLVATTLSAAHGEFWFTGLEPGKYAVREVPGSWTQSTEQPTDSPASEFFGAADVNGDWEISETELFDYIDSNNDDRLSADEINGAFDTGLGSKPSDDATATLTINSRDELQWDDDTSYTDDPYEGEAYVRPMDLNDDGLISQSEIDEAATAAALKNGSAAYESGNTSLIFGDYLGATVTGEKWEDTDGDGDGDALYNGVTFELWKDVDNSGTLSPADTFIESKDSGHTGTTGQFQFTGIKPGFDYVVVEATPSGNIADQITHDDREFAFSATSGSTHDAGDWVNLVYGSIHGVKFHDLDADGIFDFNDGEVGLPGVTFDLYKFVGSHNYTYDPASTAGTVSYTTYEWEHITSTDSAAHGEFWFTGLLPGQYVVREAEIGGNWNQRTAQPSHDPNSEFDGTIDGADGSTPNGSITLAEIEAAFNVAPGDNPGLRPTGVITITSGYEAQWDDNTTFTSDPYKGEAYNRPMDSNGNGLIDQSEIDEAIANNSLKRGSDPYAPSHFGFTPPGSEERTAWNSLVFGNYETITITGEKLEVDTADGDVAFAGIQFELYRDWGSVGVFEPGTDSLVDTATTNADGTFEFTDVQPGRDYIVVEKADQEIDPGADNQLSHDDSVYAFTAVSGQDVVIEDAWENFVYGSIHGVKFHDLNADGTYDFGDGERGIENIQFDLYKFVGTNNYSYDPFSYDGTLSYTTYEWTQVASTVSMDHGEFWFNDLEPGTYTVRENIPGTDWVSSTGQPMGDPDNTFNGVGPGPHTAASINAAFDTDLGEKPGDWALTIYSRDEFQWDDNTTFTDDPYEGEAYNRPMDTNGDGIITDADVQADTSLKNASDAIPGLRFGNYEEVTVSGHKVETNTAVGDVDFEGIEFELYKSDGTLVDTVKTDSDGEFEFTGIMPGMDYYVVEKSDQEIDPGADNQLTHDDRQYDFTAVSGEDYDAGTWENYVLGSIHGVKFHDLDADGTYDFGDGERGIENIQFDLYKFVGTNNYSYDPFSYDGTLSYTTYEWTQVASTVSMDHGEFWFNDLEPGVYAVREDISGTDWVSSTGQPMGDPNNTFNGVGAGPLTAASIMSAFDTDLGDDPDATGTAALTIYSRDELQWDDNTTFTSDPYEGEAYNRAMDTNGDGIITDADVQADTSLKNGSLAIPGLIFGNYEVGSITGIKGEDRDNNGTRDVVFPGVEFVLYEDVNKDGALDAGDVAIGDPLPTNGAGQFTFTDLEPGFYLVAEPDAQSIDPHGNQLSHDPKVFAVEIESGDDVDAGEWLNYVYGSIHGFKFLDVDEDGLWDIGGDYNGEAGADDDGKVEPVLEGVVFDLYKFVGTEKYSYNPFSGISVTFTTYEWEKVATEETNVHGEFWFLDLEPGKYSVREDLSGTYFEQTTGQAQGDPTSVFDPSSVDANNDGVITQAEIASASSVYLGDNPDDANSSTYTITSRDEFQWDDETTFEDVEDYDMAAYNRPMDLNGDGLISADEEKYAIDSTSLKNGQPADSSLMFGNKYDAGTIHGFKFDDIDGDGVWDHFPGTDYIPGNGEPGIGGILIGLEDASGNLVNLADGSPALTTTMANGEFWFENVIPDQPLTIVEYLNDLRSDSNLNGIPDGHEGMYRTTAVEEVTVSGGEELVWNAGGSVNTALIIGNAVTGSIHGFKYEDFNLNGIYEPDAHWPDVPMEWAVFQLLDSNGDIVDINGDNVGDDNDIQMTNADGEFWFTNLEIGDYTLIERMDLTDRNDLFGPGSNGNPGPPDGLPDGNGITDDQEGLGASTPTTWSVSIGSGEEYVWADGAANIDQVTAVDPDDVTAGTDISTYFDFVDMQEEFADTAASSSVLGPVLAIAPVSFSSASTGNLVYGHNLGAGSPYAADEFIFPSVAGGQSHVFGAEFDVAVMSVSIDIIGNSAGDVGLIAAYDAAGNLLDTQRSAVVGANEVTTLTFTAPTGTVIGSIEAGGDFAIASTVGLDNLTYETFPLKSEVLVGSELMFGNYYAGAVHGVKTHAGSDIGVPNIELTLSNADRTYTTTTGPDGQYVFADVVPGAYTLEETPSSAVIGGFDPFAVVVEYGTVHVSELGISSPYEGLQTESLLTSLAIENEISSSIHGIKVHGDSDVPIEGISFELRTTGGTLVLTDTTDAGGEFDFQGINPGTYQIVELDSGQPTDSFASFIITVASGEVHVWQSGEAGTLPAGQTEVANSQLVVENTLEGSIHGEVKDALGVGLSGVLVSLTNGAGNDMLTTTASGANGSFSFDDLAPGTYLVTVLGSGFINSQTTVVVDSGEEETSSALPSGTLELGQYETINTALCFQMGAANAAPVVTEVKVGSSFWTSAGSTNNFTGYVDPTDGLGYEIPTGYATVPSSFAPTSQNSVLPWRNIDKLYVEFNEAVQPPTGGWSSPGVVAIFNSSNAAVPVSNISYDATNFRLTITTADALGDDRYLLAIDDTVTDAGGAALDGEFANGTDTLFNNLGTSGDGVAGTKFEFTFAVQHADASGSGTVDVTDLSRLGTGFGGTTGNVAATANYNPYADFNGSGTIDVTDLSILGTNFGDNSIPSTPVPTNPLFLRSNAAAVDSVFGEDDDDDDDLLDSLANDVAGEGVHTARAGRFQ